MFITIKNPIEINRVVNCIVLKWKFSIPDTRSLTPESFVPIICFYFGVVRHIKKLENMEIYSQKRPKMRWPKTLTPLRVPNFCRDVPTSSNEEKKTISKISRFSYNLYRTRESNGKSSLLNYRYLLQEFRMGEREKIHFGNSIAVPNCQIFGRCSEKS